MWKTKHWLWALFLVFPLTACKTTPKPSALSCITAEYQYRVATEVPESPVAVKGSENFTSLAVEPALPAGLSLNVSTGQIVGTPTALALRTQYQFSVVTPSETRKCALFVTVRDAAPNDLHYSAVTYSFRRGVRATTGVPTRSSGSAVRYAVSPALPAGITLNATTGEIVAIAKYKQSATEYTVSVTNDEGTASSVLRIDVSAFNGTSGPNGPVFAAARDKLSDKIYVAGNFTSWDDIPAKGVARLRHDGSLDTTFQPTLTGGNVAALTTVRLEVQADGKVLLANFESGLIRFNVDGSRDEGFANAFASSSIHSLRSLASGDILVTGGFGGIKRVRNTGAIDSSFFYTFEYLYTDTSGAFFVASNDKIYWQASGHYDSIAGDHYGAGIYELDPADNYRNAVRKFPGLYKSLAVQSSGKVVLLGVNGGLSRANADFTVDSSFTTQTGFSSRDLTVLSNDNLVVTTDVNIWVPTAPCLNVFNADGTVATVFSGIVSGDFGFWEDGAGSYGMGTGVYAVLPEAEGAFSAFGSVNRVGSTAVPSYFGITSAGSVVSPLNYEQPLLAAPVAVAVQSDGKIILAGVNNPSDIPRGKKYFLRLNTDGAVDTTFNPSSVTGYVTSLVVQPDGKILVGGNELLGASTKAVARLNADGSVDNTITFDTSAINYGAQRMFRSASGKVVVAYATTNSYPGPLRIVRFNADGSRDTSFAEPTYDTYIAMWEDAQAHIFSSGNYGQGAVRLNADGTVDSSYTSTSYPFMQFADGTYASGLSRLSATGQVLATQSWNTLLGSACEANGFYPAGGDQFYASLTPACGRNLVRVNKDLTLDESFVSPTLQGTNTKIHHVLPVTGGLFAAGSFLSILNMNTPYLIRLSTSGVLQ